MIFGLFFAFIFAVLYLITCGTKKKPSGYKQKLLLDDVIIPSSFKVNCAPNESPSSAKNLNFTSKMPRRDSEGFQHIDVHPSLSNDSATQKNRCYADPSPADEPHAKLLRKTRYKEFDVALLEPGTSLDKE
ncbi:hypothetical protein WR25_24568 [Diploscapter pachys]|uniref:Uncharacterized protein n=1 Tax=Diploscapter pachys TaxID=2018661 RepID=A0A2A2LZX2_9BILA|nr:hypothetical protein WR25_24568 [Diploscapter pachys]